MFSMSSHMPLNHLATVVDLSHVKVRPKSFCQRGQKIRDLFYELIDTNIGIIVHILCAWQCVEMFYTDAFYNLQKQQIIY